MASILCLECASVWVSVSRPSVSISSLEDCQKLSPSPSLSACAKRVIMSYLFPTNAPDASSSFSSTLESMVPSRSASATLKFLWQLQRLELFGVNGAARFASSLRSCSLLTCHRRTRQLLQARQVPVVDNVALLVVFRFVFRRICVCKPQQDRNRARGADG